MDLLFEQLKMSHGKVDWRFVEMDMRFYLVIVNMDLVILVFI